ncbi:MAG TPA: TauD/TfdA family dioxygenase, partial [Acidimicrobiales bacterium]|nr:TauD/TfdA family dioxygenase [Acidimicrobiales bacterium]
RLDDPTVRGNELGGVALPYHSDGSDLVGLLCLRTAREGGLSCVANAVSIHNQMVRDHPDLAAALYEPLPYDARGEHASGGKPYYSIPGFTERADRLFVRFIPPYILASQRHPEAPRLSDLTRAAIDKAVELANDPDLNVYMDLQPGEMQFINNYHVLHGRTAYVDDPEHGYKRHLKRLWLATYALADRPAHFQALGRTHWEAKRSVSRLEAVGRP